MKNPHLFTVNHLFRNTKKQQIDPNCFKDSVSDDSWGWISPLSVSPSYEGTHKRLSPLLTLSTGNQWGMTHTKGFLQEALSSGQVQAQKELLYHPPTPTARCKVGFRKSTKIGPTAAWYPPVFLRGREEIRNLPQIIKEILRSLTPSYLIPKTTF